MTTIVRTVEFDAGHRVATHDGKCRNPHGHRYRVELAVYGPVPDSGMVVDFGVLAEVLERDVHDVLDHGFIVDRADTDLLDALAGHGWKVVIIDGPPTAENLAEWVWYAVSQTMGEWGLAMESVTLYETPKSWATFDG